MGKDEKKKEAAVNRQDENKQKKISAFFQTNTTTGSKESKLFSSVSSLKKTPKLSLKKPTVPQTEHSILSRHITSAERALETTSRTSTTKPPDLQKKPPNETKQDNSIPETQFISPAKPGCLSPDIVMIPDTPEDDKFGLPRKKKVFSSRSFLSMNADPVKRAPPPKTAKRKVSRQLGPVSVSFNCPGNSLISDSTLEVDGDVDLTSHDVVREPSIPQKHEAVTPTKTYKSDRVKRLAKSGLSPTPKRSLCIDAVPETQFLGGDDGAGCLDVVPDTEDVENSPPETLPFSTSKLKSLKNTPLPQPVKPDRKTNVEKILSHMTTSKNLTCNGVSRKLTNYQLGSSSDRKGCEVSVIDDDELLGEILGELGNKSVTKAAKKDKSKNKSPKLKDEKSKVTSDTKSVSKLPADVNVITKEEMELFRTLDESFENGTRETTPDSESPSIIMPKRKYHKERNEKAPVKNILCSYKEGSANETVDRNIREARLGENIEDLISQESNGSSSSRGQDSLYEMETKFSTPSSSQELCKEFTKLTPFKEKVAPTMDINLLESVRPADRFNRYTVTAVNYGRDDVVLDLESDGGDKKGTKCLLQGFWCDSHVTENDTVHILADLDPEGVYHVTDKKGLIIICPDLLLSGTSVVSGVHCMRRSALNEKFKGCDDKSVHMLFGSIIHCLFQQVLKQKLTTEKQMLETATTVIKLNKFLHEMYSHVTNETVVKEEINKYIPTLKKWVEKYSAVLPQMMNSSGNDLKVKKVHDIEENIWSPRFGVKGKIDLTVEVQLPASKKETKVLPLELKTGKPTFSIEHKGQVTLYSMMMSDRRSDPEEGLLLYLREPVMSSVPVKEENKRGLLQLRNELAHYVSRQVTKTNVNGHVTYQYGKLPKPINSARSCSKCPQLLNCVIYQREIEGLQHHKGHAMETLMPDTLNHLSRLHLDYFLHWSLCLELESQVERGKKVKDIWCSSSIDRERRGDCISGMVIQHTEVGQVTDSQRFAEGDSCVITFTRHKDYLRYFPSPINTLGFSTNDTIAISSEDGRLLVLATGFISSISESTVDVVVDRDVFHEDKTLQGLQFRLDRCDNFNTLGYLFTNLSRLLANQHSREKLRQLIIEKRKPEFQLTLSKGTIEQVKPIFKSLNKPQTTVILKVLMSKDYVLVKGFPGTGKTSTIVALVRVLTSMGQSVLLTSYTHSAVDNILLKLKKHKVNFLRLGRLGRIHRDIHAHSSEVLTSKITSVHELRNFYDSQSVVATSCLGTNHPIFSLRRFDVCIVDEASQVLQPACLGPLFAAERFVLVGDPKQLPPVVQSKEALQLGMSESLFASLDNTGATFDLNLQYRMNKTIMHLSNQLIYHGQLQCGSSTVAESCLPLTDSQQCSDSSCHQWLQEVMSSDLKKAAIFLDTSKVPAPESSDGKGMLKNVTEAALVLLIVSALVESGISPDSIGVIAPYRHQVKLLQQELHERHLVSIEANTVDQYQGRDKSVIVMSFVRTSTGSNKTGELLQDARRLNVAVTRAKHKLVLVGDVSTLKEYQPLQTIIDTMQTKHQIVSLPPNAHL